MDSVKSGIIVAHNLVQSQCRSIVCSLTLAAANIFSPSIHVCFWSSGGFKVDGVDPGIPVANGTAFGHGVYAAIGPRTPLHYAEVSNHTCQDLKRRGQMLILLHVSPEPHY